MLTRRMEEKHKQNQPHGWMEVGQTSVHKGNPEKCMIAIFRLREADPRSSDGVSACCWSQRTEAAQKKVKRSRGHR